MKQNIEGDHLQCFLNRDFRTGAANATRSHSPTCSCLVGAWDNSVCINAPGQSGDPRSVHYADLAEKWSKGRYVPLFYTEKAVNAVAETNIRLAPSGAGAKRHRDFQLVAAGRREWQNKFVRIPSGFLLLPVPCRPPTPSKNFGTNREPN
jgi:hypothetical protein